MIESIIDYIKKHYLLLIISFILGIIPFFWLKPGEMDLGGDASRLYFYDPWNYLKNTVLYVIAPEGMGTEYSYQFPLPFILFLSVLKLFLKSSYLLITLFNSFSLIIAFLTMFGITKELLEFKKSELKEKYANMSAIFAGLFYIFLPISFYSGWDKALLDKTQFFINPLMFWLILRYIHSSKVYYLLFSLIAAFIFSHNFSYSSAPKFFAFFPLTLIYLLLYSYLIKKIKLNIKTLIAILLLFLAMQSFHIIPQLSQLFDQNSQIYFKVISSEGRENAINYFVGLSSYVNVSNYIIGGTPPKIFNSSILSYLFVLFPTLIIIGFILNKALKWGRDQSLNFFLLSIFFLITFFFLTAKITNIGFSFYKFLFFIPGFAMFRSYVGQWSHVFLFFYSLMLGFSLFYIFSSLNKIKRNILSLFLILILLAGAFEFIKGDVINSVLTKSAGIEVKIPIVIDPKYEDTLNFIKKGPIDGKYFVLPLVDHSYQILAGLNGGAYLGPSTIAYLTGKKDFGSSIVMAPFTDPLLIDVKENNYQNINNLFPLLNIRYVFYNSDPYIYENFLDFPYQQMRQFMPLNQKSYAEFVRKLPLEEKISFGEKYHIFKVNENLYLPHLYVAKEIKYFNQEATDSATFVLNNFIEKDKDVRKVFLSDKKTFSFEINKIPSIIFTKLNPTKYKIEVFNVNGPYVLVFSEAFNTDWKLFFSDKKNFEDDKKITATYFDGDIKEGEHNDIFLDGKTFETWGRKPIGDERHFIANAYANAWEILPADTKNHSDYTLILEMSSQKIFYITLALSLFSFSVCVFWLLMVILKTRRYEG